MDVFKQSQRRLSRKMSEPVELVVKGKETVVGYACALCGASFLIHRDAGIEEVRSQHDAAQNHCGRKCACGEALDGHYQLACMKCQVAAHARKEQRRFEQAEKLTIEAYDGPVFWEDEYYFSVDELLDHCEDQELELPTYVWATTPSRFSLSAEDVLGRELERQDMYEDAFDAIPEQTRKSLQAYFDVWCKELDMVSYHCDTSRAVVLRPDEVAAAS